MEAALHDEPVRSVELGIVHQKMKIYSPSSCYKH